MPKQPLIYAVFFLSGAAALVYQIVWVRQLSLVFGGSHLAIATVLAVFMGGIALGGHLAARYANLSCNHLRTYAKLEFGIAIGAGLFHALTMLYPNLYVALASLAPESTTYLTLIRVSLAALVLLPITTLMGATLPILVDFFSARLEHIGRRLSALYAINTAGAVTGVVFAGFVLLPATSINVTVIAALAMNLVAACSAWAMARDKDHILITREQPPVNPEGPSSTVVQFILLATAISGFCALAYEVLWTRVLIIGLGATDYGFSSILAAFLVGIGAGSAIYNGFLARQSNTNCSGHRLLGRLGMTHVVIAVSIGFSVFCLYRLPATYLAIRNIIEATGIGQFPARQVANLAIAFVYLGIPALAMGISFPLAGEVLGRYRSSTAATVGQLAATNTIGALLGSLAAGFVLTQVVGIERAIQLIVLLNLTCGLLLIARAANRQRLVYAIPVAGSIIGIIAIANPDLLRVWDKHFFAIYRSNQNEQYVTRAQIDDALERYQVLYYGEGSTSIVAATQLGDLKIFTTNGRVEATSATQDAQNQLALGHLPMLLHPNPKKVLVVGGGAGMTLGATSIYPTLESLTLVELEPKVLGVIDSFSDHNHSVLKNNLLRVIINDGRNHLLTAKQQQYDVITSDPIHPWFRGAGYLYTKEYFSLAAERMNQDGIMAQWLPLYEMDAAHIKAVIASFAAAFEHTSIWLMYTDAVLIGSKEPLKVDLDRIDSLQAGVPELAEDLRSVNMGGPAENLLSYFLTGTSGVSRLIQGATVNTDDNLYLEFDTPRAIGHFTESANIRMLSKERDTLVPYLVPTNTPRVFSWYTLEKEGVFSTMDELHHAAIKKTEPSEIKQLTKRLSSIQGIGDIGRWVTIRSYLPRS